MIKTCTRCGKTKPIEEFPFARKRKNERHARCRPCQSEVVREIYHAKPELHMLERARQRARRKGLDYDLTPEDILPLPTHCPVFGFELEPNNGHQNPKSYSLDRIDNSKGYVRGNVVVMSYLANRLKNDGTAAQHRRIAEWMEENGAP